MRTETGGEGGREGCGGERLADLIVSAGAAAEKNAGSGFHSDAFRCGGTACSTGRLGLARGTAASPLMRNTAGVFGGKGFHRH